jgi:hypothetical protein
MKHPSFSEGVAVALAAAVTGSVAYSVLHDLIGFRWAGHALTSGLGLGYILYLLARSRDRVGRLVTLAAWLLCSGTSWFVLEDPSLYLLTQAGMIWLVRSLYHQPGPLAAILDLALGLAALAAGVWAFVHADSLFLGIWTYFLVQALFVTIPSANGRRPAGRTGADSDPDLFQTAYRSADAALRKLSAHR